MKGRLFKTWERAVGSPQKTIEFGYVYRLKYKGKKYHFTKRVRAGGEIDYKISSCQGSCEKKSKINSLVNFSWALEFTILYMIKEFNKTGKRSLSKSEFQKKHPVPINKPAVSVG